MSLVHLLYLAVTGAFFGFGCVAAYYHSRGSREANRYLKAASALLAESGEAEEFNKESQFGMHGRRRTSRCVSLPPHGAIRAVDGGFIRGYRVEMQASLMREQPQVEDTYNRFGQLLAAEKPAGTISQWRFAHHRERGEVLRAHLDAAGDETNTYAPARALHEHDLGFYAGLVEQGHYRRPSESFWVYVPTKHFKDEGQNHLTGIVRRWLKLGGLSSGWSGVRESFRSGTDGLVRRMLEYEMECYEDAERVFRMIESASPLRLERLSHEETWNALYMGHNENATMPPLPPSSPYVDIRDILCGDTIEGTGWYLLHGSTPVAVVTLFAPPEPGSYAGIMRNLTNNPGLSCRYTIVAECQQLDKRKAKKGLKSRESRILKVKKKGGQPKLDADDIRALEDIRAVERDLTNSGEALTRLRFFAVIYGDQARTQPELRKSVKQLEKDCERFIAAVRRAMPGADARREEPAALRAIYHGTLVGEMNPKRKTGREIEEVSDSIAGMIPAEASWGGIPGGHHLVSTVSGELITLNFFRNKYTTSPTVLVIANSGGGKSVFLARCAKDVLAAEPHARVRVVDFGESLGPLVDVVGGRHIRFTLDEVRAINVWDFPGIELGDPALVDEAQVTLVVEELLILSRTDPSTETGALRESIIRKLVKLVYEDEVPRNQPDWPRHEPTHSHFLNKLKYFPFEHPKHREVAQDLMLMLDEYRGHPWLDAPTHEDYRQDSPLDVYELDSLDVFPRDIKHVIAFRVGARVVRTIGEKIDGELSPTLLIFDEMKKIRDSFPEIMKAINKGARQGRKENVVTMLGTQAYEHLDMLPDITANAGAKVIGKQIGNFERMVKDFGWPAGAARTISGIRNVKGSHAQFVVSFGSGDDQQLELVQLDLSSTLLWTLTSDPVEKNARARVSRLLPHWSTWEVVSWLSAFYPRGLVFAGRTQIDDGLLPQDEIARLDPDEERLWEEEHAELAGRVEYASLKPGGPLLDEEAQGELFDVMEGFFAEHGVAREGAGFRRPNEDEAAMIDIPGVVIREAEEDRAAGQFVN